MRNAVDVAHALGLARPRVAILAAVETVNPHMPATPDAAALCNASCAVALVVARRLGQSTAGATSQAASIPPAPGVVVSKRALEAHWSFESMNDAGQPTKRSCHRRLAEEGMHR